MPEFPITFQEIKLALGSAVRGNRQLDVAIENFLIGGGRGGAHYIWSQIGIIGWPKHFTTSLDARIFGECIVETKYHESPNGDDSYWTAIHCAPGQPFAGTTIRVYHGKARGEILARRIAGLEAFNDRQRKQS